MFKNKDEISLLLYGTLDRHFLPFRNLAKSQLLNTKCSNFFFSKTFPIYLGCTCKISAHLVKIWRHYGSLKLASFMLFYLKAKNFRPIFLKRPNGPDFSFACFRCPLGRSIRKYGQIPIASSKSYLASEEHCVR